jgi:cell wall-associated NlpC family hydrolase
MDLDQWITAHLGTPYTEAHDCWGFVRACYAQRGVCISEDYRAASHVFHRIQAPYQPWDLLIFRLASWTPRHMGISLGGARFAHCSRATNGVARGDLRRLPWQGHLRYGVRLKPC